MRWTMSDKPCEALRIRWIRSQCRRLPRWSAYLWSDMVKPRSCEVESACESSLPVSTSKRQYGVEVGGNPAFPTGWVNSTLADSANTSGYMGCKPSASTGGAKSEKIISQIHKTFYPDLGCSGDLNLTVTVHPVNVGTSCFGLRTGLAAVDEKHEGRESRSSRRYGKHTTWRRILASGES
jgi:hypothetical protein